MLILSIDTSSAQGSAALFEENKPVLVMSGDEKETYSSRLFRWLEELRNRLKKGLDALDGVSVTVGPGSFTGLRIGVAAAKGISLACGCPIVPFSTLEAMALAVEEGPRLRCPLLSAGRGEVYTAVYRFVGGGLERLGVEYVTKPEDVALSELNAPALFFGNGLALCRQHLEKQALEGSVLRNEHPVLAPAMARSAAAKLRAGKGLSPQQLRMNYIRLSDAERARDTQPDSGSH